MEKPGSSKRSRKMISWPLQMLLCLFGIWPGVSCGLLRKMLWLMAMIACTIFQFMFLVIRARSVDFTFFIYAVALTLALTMKFIKMVFFWFNQRKFNEMWGTMSMNREFDTAQYTSAVDTASKRRLLHYMPNFVVTFNTVSVIMTSAGTISAVIHYDEASNATRPYILLMHLPFDTSRYSVYVLVIILQFSYLLILSAGAATLNSVLIILMLHLGDQIDILCRCLTQMSQILQGKNEHKKDVAILKEIIRKHQSVIIFSENIESLYTYIALILLVFNTLITCGLGFVLVTSVGSPNFSKMVRKNLMFYCVINIETFVFCFAGEYLSAKWKEIGEAAYDSPWYQSKFHGQTILFMIMRSQSQMTITMGKFMDLSLERFSSIVKASASYVSVLLAMY